MKIDALRKFRGKIAANNPVFGLWVTLESASITEMAVAAGLDWVVIDAEHGHLDFKEVLEHIRSTVRSDTVVLVRIAELNSALIKRVLDIGADGIVVPWIETEEQLRQAVAYAHYPPEGLRGVGAERATCWGRCFTEHTDEANEHVLVVPIVETVKGGRNIEQLCRVPGVDVMFFGPADYSSTAGFRGQWEGPGVAEALLSIKDVIRRHGKHVGVVATSNDDLLMRRDQGFRMLGLGLDSGLFLRSLSEAIATTGREFTISPTFSPETIATSPETETALPPPGFEPDRPEVITTRAMATRVELERGVIFQPLVSAENGAQNLTTGLVTFMPGATLPYHLHPHGEAVTVLSGEMCAEIEGRRYRLGPLDNIAIPAGTAHMATNISSSKPAVLHIAMPTDTPTRTWIDSSFIQQDMPKSATGQGVPECVSPHATTAWYDAAPGARFQNYFNLELGFPGMSGGYGRFEPGSRLSCHLHDFDESISLIEGTAICIVEGREYSVADYTTALVPRGRCHYFVNRSNAPMAMIWVYAGDMPERLALDERCCTIDGCR